MWTRSNKDNGKFEVVVWDYNNKEVYRDEFDTAYEADRAAEEKERLNLMNVELDVRYGELTDAEKDMSLDDIMDALEL